MGNEPHLYKELMDARRRNIPVYIFYSHDVPAETRTDYERLLTGFDTVKIYERDINTKGDYDSILQQVKKACEELHLFDDIVEFVRSVQDGNIFIVIGNRSYFKLFNFEMRLKAIIEMGMHGDRL